MNRIGIAILVMAFLVAGFSRATLGAESNASSKGMKSADNTDANVYEYSLADPFEKNQHLLSVSPSIPGPSGMIRNPSAYVLEKWDYNVGLDVVGWQDYVKVNVGLPNRLEAGVSFIERAQEEGAINIKWNFVPEAEDHPAVAVGLFDIGSTKGRTKYAVVSKNITSLRNFKSRHKIRTLALRGHMGYKSTNTRDDYFYGLEAKFIPRKDSAFLKTLGKTTFMEEYDGDHFNFGMRYELSAFTKLNFGLLSTDDINVGISYSKSL